MSSPGETEKEEKSVLLELEAQESLIDSHFLTMQNQSMTKT